MICCKKKLKKIRNLIAYIKNIQQNPEQLKLIKQKILRQRGNTSLSEGRIQIGPTTNETPTRIRTRKHQTTRPPRSHFSNFNSAKERERREDPDEVVSGKIERERL